MRSGNNLYVIYDKECFFCSRTALALRIREKVGKLILINAREDHELVATALHNGLDINTGIVVYYQNEFYHGKQAVVFLNKVADSSSLSQQIKQLLFKNKISVFLGYPVLKILRNISLRLSKKPKINNNNYPEIFKSVFAEQWPLLPQVIKNHYRNKPYSNDITRASGEMNITFSPILKSLSPLFSRFKLFAPAEAKNLPVEVDYLSNPKDNRFVFQRRFYYPNTTQPFEFTTTLWPIKNKLVVDTLRFGLGLNFHYEYDGNKVKFVQKGYSLKIGKIRIPLPLGLLLGKGYGEEVPIDENTFDFFIESNHPLFGNIIRYEGRFKLLD